MEKALPKAADEAAFRKTGFRPLGPADGPVKRAVLGENAAKLYGLDPGAAKAG